MLSIPLDSDSRQVEIATIKKIAAVNQIELDVDQMIRRMSTRSLLAENRLSPPTANSSSHKQRWIQLPYLGPASDKLASLLKRYDYRVGFYPLSTVRQLVQLKDRSSKFDKSGIYQLTCGQCQAVYIGQTGRKLGVRMAEHRTAINLHQLRSQRLPITVSLANMIFQKQRYSYSTHALRAVSWTSLRKLKL